ncbi:LysM peptidoglycan-binding domain-containing protein [Brevibacillus ginsengisoli]|uniref:LysM peptidoglycan-binding domain-containing protein n=1 Tax=Brevibacillus ginsengisoli TaxID=363854 RepID=UPI003CF3561F
MRRSRRNKNVVESMVDDTVKTTTGLPPRKTRFAKKQNERKKMFFIVGLILFGSIAIGMISYELYQASRNMPTVQYQAEKETTIEKINQESVIQAASANKPQPTDLPAQPKMSPSAAPAHANMVVQPAAVQKTDNAATKAATSPGTNTPQLKSQQTTQSEEKPKLARHRVEAGDTLFKLSRKYYGNVSGVDRIARYNHLNPDEPLPTGRVVYVPLR